MRSHPLHLPSLSDDVTEGVGGFEWRSLTDLSGMRGEKVGVCREQVRAPKVPLTMLDGGDAVPFCKAKLLRPVPLAFYDGAAAAPDGHQTDGCCPHANRSSVTYYLLPRPLIRAGV